MPLVPILIWNAVFFKSLPEKFQPDLFNSNIPEWILVAENTLRVVIFALPLFLKTEIRNHSGQIGFKLYIAGCSIYFVSWLLLIWNPKLSENYFLFTAPAYTPLIWLFGLSLLFDGYYFDLKFKVWHYLLPSLFFITFHFLHTTLVYLR